MSMQKTLGGDRLGSGKKMQVNLHGYDRSTHDMGYVWRSTMSAGTLVPFLCEVGLPGDTFDINLECDIKTHPTVGPLFGSFKVQLDVFQAPVRLYQGKLHNNKLGIGLNMANVKLPLLSINAHPTTNAPDPDNSQINPSCVLAYLGIRGVGRTASEQSRNFNGVPILAYWDIYKNYYSNKQEEVGYVIHTPFSAINETVTAIEFQGTPLSEAPTISPIFINGPIEITIAYTGTRPDTNTIIVTGDNNQQYAIGTLGREISDTAGVITIVYDWQLWGDITVLNWRYLTEQEPQPGQIALTEFDLSEIDDMREAILEHSSQTTPFSIFLANLAPWNLLVDSSGNSSRQLLQSQEGLGIKTYQSDLFNNWLQTEWIDGTNGINEITAIDTSGGSFTIDTLMLSRKVYDMLNRIAVSGGTYDDWLDAVYTHDRYTRCESPMYMGGLIKELIFQEVVSNAEAGGGGSAQPLGTLAGKGIMGKKHKGGNVRVKVDEISYVIGIISLTPRIDYSQGNKWDAHLLTMDDFHKPALDEIGFQELITEQMAWWDTAWDGDEWIQKSAGKQPAWINYMTNVNRVYGNFAIASNEMFMTLNRRYEHSESTGLVDLTTYIDPAKFNHIFAKKSLDSQNFWTQIAVDITARRKMSAKIMPNL